MRILLSLLLIGCAPAPQLATTESTPAPARSPERVDGFARELLTEHNRVRDSVGVAPLNWSDAIAEYAQGWVDDLAARGCPPTHRDDSPYGENIAAWSGNRPAGDAVRMWEEERPLYDGGPMNDRNFAAGHYTQVVWSTTREVGCGRAACGAVTLLVCNYLPPGNMYGEPAYGPEAGP